VIERAEEHIFSADQPIQNREEDLLGRRDFGEALARAIAGWHGNESLAVGIFGEWGSGKSSLKNMILEALEDDAVVEREPPVVVEYNPWQFAGQERLIEGFFEEVANQIDLPDPGKKHRELARKLRAYGAKLSLGALAAGGLNRVAKGLLIILLLLFGAGAFISFWKGPLGGLVSLCALGLTLLAAVLAWAGKFSRRVASTCEALARTEEKSLSETKAELSENLAEMDRSLLVVMDDIDRLAAGEVRRLFQLVKANADFPNMMYLLLFQRDIVENSLEELSPGSGREYLDKIVQAPFDIPSVEKARLERVLNGRIEKTLDETGLLARFDRKRWYDIYGAGLSEYSTNLRDVHRYSSSLSFHAGLLQSEGVPEVNPVDLIGVEALRVFEPDVYRMLARMKSALIAQKDSLLTKGLTEDAAEQMLQSLLDASTDERSKATEAVLSELFPRAQWVYGSVGGFGHSIVEEWHRALRVCTEDFFVDPDTVMQRIEELRGKELGEKEMLAVEEFRRAVRRREEGRDNHDWPHDD
jgi:predicted KAP-like P-loop ATPase